MIGKTVRWVVPGLDEFREGIILDSVLALPDNSGSHVPVTYYLIQSSGYLHLLLPSKICEIVKEKIPERATIKSQF